MKILHTSDWHLGKHLSNYSRHAEQQDVLNEICEIADKEEVNAVIVAGDLFDTYNPSTESTELFYKTLKRLTSNGKRAVIAIAGNHDSPDRIEAPDPLARECGIIFAGYPNSVVPPFTLESGLSIDQSAEGFFSLQIPGTDFPLRIIMTPYANEFRLKTYLGQEDSEAGLRNLLKEKWSQLTAQYCNEKGINILIAHLLFVRSGAEVPEEPEEEKPILHIGGAQVIYADDIPAQIQYTALGHLHQKQRVDSSSSPVIYSGSPLSYSFSEANQKKYVVVIDAQPGKQAALKDIELTCGRKLLRKKASTIAEALEWLTANQNALVELTMETDTYLTADERKKLTLAHDGIVTLIPDVKDKTGLDASHHHNIDLSKDMEDLFVDYFKHEKGQEPHPAIMNLLKEVLSEDDQT